MSKLVICEKPSVAKSIASALGVASRADGYFEGGGWLISWCIGHLVGLADAAAYDDRYKKWRYEDLPILPAPFRYVVSEEKADQFHILRSLMERPDVTELVNACDAGREGELIFRLVYEAAGCSKPFSRLWISSMEDAAIREGFADLRPGADYDPLYQSALCRQKADWLIGINASRLFSVLYHRTLNIGRVQTPTLAMLADRDGKIVLFRKEKYHHVRLTLEEAEAVSDRIVSPEDAQTIRDACDGQQAVCVSLVREKKTEKPPKLYDLTTLQREANRVFGYTAKQTLDYAQSLYEKKLLTYPRTDSRYLTSDMAETGSKTCPSVKAGRTPSASSSSGFSFREERNTFWMVRQPWESTCFPFAVKVCPPQSKVAVTTSYTKGSAAAHSSLQQTSRRILRSPTGSAGISAFSSSRVGIRAWWSDTSLSFTSAATSGKNSGQASKGGTRAARCRTTEAVSAISLVRYRLSVRG